MSDETTTLIVDRDGRRVRYYQPVNPARPGQQERRRQRALGLSWCRGCEAWLPVADVTRQGACRPCTNAEYRTQYAANPEPIRLQKQARKRALEPIPAWWAVDHADAFGGECAYGCGRSGTTWDHVWPVSLGGRSTPGNLAPACISCNSSKNNRHPEPWVERGIAAFPNQWGDLIALAIEHNTDEWTEAVR